jgi:hypothetical protein
MLKIESWAKRPESYQMAFEGGLYHLVKSRDGTSYQIERNQLMESPKTKAIDF